MKKIILSFDSFKGCISAEESCHCAAHAVKSIFREADVRCVPLSDGGEGLVKSVTSALGKDELKMVSVDAHGPLMEKIKAKYAIAADGSVAYMEMAETSGLPLVPMEKRNPMLTTTYGVGDMILDAWKRGCKEIVMGIGGSATCDGGRGMLKCLMSELKDLSVLPHITVACDVNNPLYGENGAAYIFAPQKGATPSQVVLLDEQLRAFARETETAGIATPELCEYPGTGAAGGLGYGLIAYLKAELKSGIDIILDINHFDDTIKDADLVITGEGKSDAQTLMGKVPHGVLKRCKSRGIPVWLISGCIEDADGKLGREFNFVGCINEGDSRPLNVLMKKEVALDNMKKYIEKVMNELREKNMSS